MPTNGCRWPFEREATCPACGRRCAVDKAGRLAWHASQPRQPGRYKRRPRCLNRTPGSIEPRTLEVEA
jgi:hypothetical protein